MHYDTYLYGTAAQIRLPCGISIGNEESSEGLVQPNQQDLDKRAARELLCPSKVTLAWKAQFLLQCDEARI